MIELKNCTKVYRNGNTGIEEVNLKLPIHGIVGIFGDSGSGKSSLINCLGGLDNFSSGEILYNGKKIESLYPYTSYVFQEYKLIEHMSILDNLAIANPNLTKEEINSMLFSFGLHEHKNNPVNKISGGQRQRVEVLRAILAGSDIILCDEPIANLDEETGEEILKLFEKIKEHKLILIVSHNKKVLEKYADIFIEIENHKVISTTLGENEDSIYEYIEKTTSSLSFKYALRLAFQNIKNNKLKAGMTGIFLFISFLMLSCIFIILSMDKAQIIYDAFQTEEHSFLSLQNCSDTNPFSVKNYKLDENNVFQTVSRQKIEAMNANIVLYYGKECILDYKKEKLSFHRIWEIQDGTYQEYSLESNEILLNKQKISEAFPDTYNSLIGECLFIGDESLRIKGIIDFSESKDMEYLPELIMNSETFEHISANMSKSNTVLMRDRLNEDRGVIVNVYNPFLHSEQEKSLFSGTLPNSDHEICVTRSWLKENGYDPNMSLGTQVEVQFYSVDEEGVPYSNPRAYKVVGISRSKLIFSLPETKLIFKQYSLDALQQANKAIIEQNYTKDTFIKALKIGICPVSMAVFDAGSVIRFFTNFNLVFLLLALVFLLIAFFTLANSLLTSLIKNKKNIGVLIAFKMKPISILKLFLIENMVVGLIAFAIAASCYYPLYLYLESLAYNHLQNPIHITYFSLNYWCYPCLLAVGIGMGLSCLIFPFRKIIRNKPIEILNEKI